MSYDYFNTSSLAFGTKLTTAFNSLSRLIDETKESMAYIQEARDFYAPYYEKNFDVPIPKTPQSAVRTEYFSDWALTADPRVEYEFANDGIDFTVVTKDSAYGVVTKHVGYTQDNVGSVYGIREYRTSGDVQLLSFVEKEGYDHLFDYRYSNQKWIILSNQNTDLIPLEYGEYNQYRELNVVETVTPGSYTATDYECVVLSGYEQYAPPNIQRQKLEVYLNDDLVCDTTESLGFSKVVLYLRPGDVIKGKYSNGLRILYQ